MIVKVSVILPSLNVRNYIEEAVRSARQQTLSEIEILCIDAGSEDGTWEILSGLAKIDSRIRLFHSDVKSYGYQVNMGIHMAQGEYIAVLETDDYADIHMYERLYSEAVLNDCDYVKGDYTLYHTQKGGKRVFLRRNILQTDGLYGEVIEPIKHPAVAVDDNYLWNGIYKREFLKRNQITFAETPGAAYQDIGFMYQINIFAERALYVKESCYFYCTDREGASANSGKGLQYAYQEYLRLYQWLQADGAGEERFRTLYCRMAKSFIYCWGDPEEEKTKISGAERSKYYFWFQQKLTGTLRKNLADRTAFHPQAWKKLETMLVSETYYIEKCRARKQKIRDTLGRPGAYPIVIFGCGHYGAEACGWLEEQAYHVQLFADNNRALWGTKVNGILVSSPEQAREKLATAKYLIANEKHSAQMRQQLLEMGIAESDICIYL